MKINKSIYLLILLFSLCMNVSHAQPSTCSYQTYKWNTKLKRAVEIKEVKHSYSNLRKYEVDKITGCTVCREDQVEIKLPNIKPFLICKVLAKGINKTLLKSINAGETINSVVGYRVGMTRGKIDELYNRTQFSNHSYGIAIDLNSKQNGLYDRCITFSKKCRLIRGGIWNPNKSGSITKNGYIVYHMKQLGLRWGGNIAGKQKDFMHFSPSGY